MTEKAIGPAGLIVFEVAILQELLGRAELTLALQGVVLAYAVSLPILATSVIIRWLEGSVWIVELFLVGAVAWFVGTAAIFFHFSWLAGALFVLATALLAWVFPAVMFVDTLRNH